MQTGDVEWLALLRGMRAPDEVSRATGVPQSELTAACAAWLRRQAALGDRSFSGAVGGLVEIRRDRAGVPHVFAGSTQDLFFGLGAAMAQDRLWQMDRLRRRALGRQAEILGPGYIGTDTAHLTVGIDRIAAVEAEAMDGATHAAVAALAAGINRQIEAFGSDLPIEFKLLEYNPAPFSVADLIAIARGIWWSLNGRIDRIAAAEAARFMPNERLRVLYLTPEASENLVVPADTITPPHAAGTDDATGSNNWALSPARSASGHSMLCGDPHQPFWVPSSWYEFALHGPEDNCAGAGHPGLPGLWWGSNGQVAWSITNNAASTRDLYREEIHPADPGRYRDGDDWREFEERSLTLPVRGEAARSLVVRSTVRGPVVNALVPAVTEGGDPPLSLRWVGAEHIDDMRAMIAVQRARDWAGFRAALRDWSVAVFNFVYAGRDGTIGYQMAGRVPIRGRVTYGFRDAGEPADQWLGYIPFEGLPTHHSPARGYVASANQRIVAPDYPYPIYGAYSQGHRGIRLDQAFTGTSILDQAANIAVQNDVKNCRAELLCPHIVRHLAGSAAADVHAFAAVLSGWDFRYETGSAAPTLFEAFMARWQREVLAVLLPERLLDLTMQQTGLAAHLLTGGEPGYFAEGTAARCVAVARQAVATLRAHFGDELGKWNWGRVHLAHWRHPLSNPVLSAGFDIGPAPVDGGSHTLRNTGGELPPHLASSGAEYRIVVDMAQPDRFLAVQNIGNSGVPGSPHYRDQFDDWLRGTYHVIELRGDRLDVESTTSIAPA